MMTFEQAKKLVRAHQYIYYVLCPPRIAWSDFAYDKFCDYYGIQGGGGSDLPEDYTPEEIALALSEYDKPTDPTVPDIKNYNPDL